ncbi:MAG: asparagine synthase (glutamine-hydrolyzing) [Bacteroidales bacterium]
MCGINGVWHRDKTINEQAFTAMRDSMIHRGPDDAGTWYNANKNMAFGHRRLSFMDLTESGKQPMLSADNNIIITVNGEIYNYPELKQELEAKGHQFVSQSDSEVIIHAWREWGTDMLPKLNGMFAFALYDMSNESILLARDRFGIKPLYYHIDGNNLFFGSEIKAILHYEPGLKIIRPQSLADYFTYRYVPSPYSIYQDIYKLEPGSYMLIKQGKPMVKKYHEFTGNNLHIKQKDITPALYSMFKNSVKMHTQSEVPVGSFLSGGYDSSAIVYMLKKNKLTANTFSIGFSDWEESEDQYAKLVADHFNMPHFSKKAKGGHLDMMDKLMYHYDEPIADISIIPTYLVSELAAGHNKAVLSGEGADELFSGYTWHYENMEALNRQKRWWQKNPDLPPFSVEAYSRAMAMGHLRHNELTSLFTQEYKEHIPEDSDWFYRKHATGKPDLDRFRRMDLRCFMGELVLTKIDRASMAHSLEVRVPFLENELSDFLMKLPPDLVYKKGYKKYRLYQLIKNALPEPILKRKKQGFVGPDIYYQNKSWYQQVVNDSQLVKDKILNSKTLTNYIDRESYWKLWKFAVLEHWYQQWITN